MLWDTKLPGLVWNTLRLGAGVGIGTFLLGTTLAWIVVMYEFPGKRFFEWSLLLPLSMPGYVIGFVYISAFEYGSVVPEILEGCFGIKGWYPETSGALWVITVMTLVLYPYVYLMSKTAFMEQNLTLMEAARGLGQNKRQLFWRVAIPLARPSIFAGVSLAVMESLADFGTVGVFSYDTFTTAIYDVWFGLYDRQVATQLAGLLLLLVFLVLWFETSMKKRSRYYQVKGTRRTLSPVRPAKPIQLMLFSYPSIILFFAFFAPFSILVHWTINSENGFLSDNIVQSAFNSFSLGAAAGIVIIGIALILAYGKRLEPGKTVSSMVRVATSGYAIPGSVVAVGILIPLSWLDHGLNNIFSGLFGITLGLILTGSLVGIMFAYVVRFLTMGFNSINSSLERITPSMDMAGRILGENRFGVLRRVHLSLLKPGLITGFILVFIEVMKEMPATLLMRPFGFETLATRIWQLTSESLAEEAALPSIIIVIMGLIPVMLLIRLSNNKR